MRRFIIALFFIVSFVPVASYADVIKGRVYGTIDGKKDPLDAAVVKWINTTIGEITDEKGFFEIPDNNITDKRLVVSYTGFATDTVDVGSKSFAEVILIANATTEAILVEDRQGSTYFEAVTAKTEVVTSQELVKDACCDLSGCFGRNSSVEVAVTDIITDSKELKMLGLEGVYTQILTDNMPVFSGLNMKFGVSSIPGTLIDKITISKGSNSVLHGYESISGIMNVLLKDYDNSDKLLVNAFLNSMLEKQVNMNFAQNTGKEWSTIASFHSAQKSNRMDDNGDGFLDNPLTTRYVLYNKWKYSDKKSKTDFNISGRYWNEERIGGQTTYDIGKDEGSNTIYGQPVNINSFEGYSRYSKTVGVNKSMKFYLSGSGYDQNSFYGFTKYDAGQTNINAIGFYEFEVSDLVIFKTGLSYKYHKTDQQISFLDSTTRNYNGDYKELESVPGAFVENSFNFLGNTATLSAGLRFDLHNTYGAVVTPRALLRYQPYKDVVIRASGGTGFRIADIFSEYSNILASSRNIVITEELDPERVLNFGTDLLLYFQTGILSGSLNFDYYHTTFFSKVIPDYDTDPTVAYFSNQEGGAHSNVFQAELNMNLIKEIDLKLAYKFIDNKYDLNGVTYDQPFNSKDRFFATFSYVPLDNSFIVSAGLQWFGKQRLPSTESNPLQYRRPLESEPYTMINAQISKNFSFLEIYAGVENLLDFTQANPIISADDPFGEYFDTSFIWGPTRGREYYFGFRFLMD
jgi:outer membrane receptor for ferrienterochelin and colicin